MKNLLWFLSLVVFVAVLVVTVQYYPHWQHWMSYETGSLNTPGTPPNYNYWSGFGSVFPWEAGLFLAVAHGISVHYRMNNCHVDRCPWLGRYQVAGGHYKVCRRHHPESHVRGKRVTFEHIQYAHALHLLRSGAKPLKKESS